MADNPVRNIAPFINDRFLVTSKWWKMRWGKLHRGLDIATSNKKNVYSILDGVVHSLGYDSSRGNWIIIWDNNEESPTYGYASLYMHLNARPLLIVGQAISKNEYVGLEGTTGSSTGVHLHVEMQDISRFNNQWHISDIQSDYLDPTVYMGIDNEEGTWWIYDGTPGPSPVIESDKVISKKFPWVLYAKKLRNKRRNL